MSGIVAIINFDNSAVGYDTFDKMLSSMDSLGLDGRFSFIQNNFAFGLQRLCLTKQDIAEPGIITDEHDNLILFDGRLFNRDELLSKLKGVQPEFSDSRLLLAAYRHWGRDFASQLDGEFAFFLYDKRKQRSYFARDPMGFRPLYYSLSSKRLLVASEMKALLAHPEISTAPDLEGLRDCFAMAIKKHSEVTCFKDIKSVDPSHLMALEQGKTEKIRYFEFDTARTIRLASIHEYVEAACDLLTKAVKVRLNSAFPVAISVSGGLDSSSIYGITSHLSKSGQTSTPFLGISFFDPQCLEGDERDYILTLEEFTNTEIFKIPADRNLGLKDYCAKQVGAAEIPQVDSSSAVTWSARKLATQKNARVILSGTWGDQIFNSWSYIIDLIRSARWTTAIQHIYGLRQWKEMFSYNPTRQLAILMARSYLPKGILAALRKGYKKRFEQDAYFGLYKNSPLKTEMEGLWPSEANRKLFASEHAAEIFYEARLQKNNLRLQWSSKIFGAEGLVPSYPVLDRNLLSFLMAIPGEIMNSGGNPRELLRMSVEGLIPEKIRLRRTKGDFTDILNHTVNRDLNETLAQLNQNSRVCRQGYIKNEALEQYKDRLQRDRNRDNSLLSWAFNDLYALELWLQHYQVG